MALSELARFLPKPNHANRYLRSGLRQRGPAGAPMLGDDMPGADDDEAIAAAPPPDPLAAG